MATSFSGGRSWSTRREPPTMGKQLVNFINCGCEFVYWRIIAEGTDVYKKRFDGFVVTTVFFDCLFYKH
jgi:hypothetical protein